MRPRVSLDGDRADQRSTREQRCRRRAHLFGGHVAQVLRQRPLVSEGIDDLAVAVAPEHVLERLEHFCPRIHGTLPQRVDVVAVEAERDVDAVHRQRRHDAHLRELVGDHDRRVAETQLDLHELAVGDGYAPAFLGAQRLDVPARGAIGVAADEVRRDRVPRFSGFCQSSHQLLLNRPGRGSVNACVRSGGAAACSVGRGGPASARTTASAAVAASAPATQTHGHPPKARISPATGAAPAAAKPIAASPAPSTWTRSAGRTDPAMRALPPTTLKFQPIPSTISVAVRADAPLRSIIAPPMADASTITSPAEATALGPLRSTSRPESGDGANMPATWNATTVPIISTSWPCPIRWIGATAITATIAKFAATSTTNPSRAGGVRTPRAIS